MLLTNTSSHTGDWCQQLRIGTGGSCSGPDSPLAHRRQHGGTRRCLVTDSPARTAAANSPPTPTSPAPDGRSACPAAPVEDRPAGAWRGEGLGYGRDRVTCPPAASVSGGRSSPPGSPPTRTPEPRDGE